jgi:hypothetical protein
VEKDGPAGGVDHVFFFARELWALRQLPNFIRVRWLAKWGYPKTTRTLRLKMEHQQSTFGSPNFSGKNHMHKKA